MIKIHNVFLYAYILCGIEIKTWEIYKHMFSCSVENVSEEIIIEIKNYVKIKLY